MRASKPEITPESGRSRGLGLAGLVERELLLLRDQLAGVEDPKERSKLAKEIRSLRALMTKLVPEPKRRKPPESGLPVPAIAPRGPLPKQGGAAAPLEFDS
ncbi:MAG TPA: hypothetical protein VK913_07660 [Erythrobacter sp.]|nr:hypothetical protein [Erythrobacter sp.]